MTPELVNAARTDEIAMQHLLNECLAFCKSHQLLRLLPDPDDQDEVVQNALIRVWKALPKTEIHTAFDAWLFSILKREYFRYILMKNAPNVPLSFDSLLEDGADIDVINELDPAREYESRDTLEHVIEGASTFLTTREFECLILCGYQGFTAREAADILDSREDVVWKHVSIARRKLREHFNEDGTDLDIDPTPSIV